MKLINKRITSLILAVSIIVTGSGVSIMAQSVKEKELNIIQDKNIKKKNKIKQKKKLSYDEIAKQLQNGTYKGKKIDESKSHTTYQESDGSFILVGYNSPIRYEDKNGKLKAYDSKLISTKNKEAVKYSGDARAESYNTDAYVYENKAGDSRQFLPDELSEETPILMESGGYSLSFYPEEIEVGKVELKNENAEYISEDKGETYQYESLDNGVKENIIFHKAPEENIYSFSYTLGGMYMKADKNTNTVGLYDSNTNKQVALLQAPFLNDITKCNYNYDIDTKVSNNENEWTVTYILPQKYLNSSNTSYPVTLDPTVVWVTENNSYEPIGISYVIELPDAGDYHQYFNAVNRFTIGRSGAGDYYKTYMQFKDLNSSLEGKTVHMASLNLNVAQQVGGDMKVDMHEVKENWNLMELNWATEPEVSDDILSQSVIGTEDCSYQIDFTKYCNMVAKGQADATKGVELRTEQNTKYMELWGIRNQGKAPLFIISYSSSPQNIKSTYDGTFNISGDYDAETNKINVSWDAYLDLGAGPGRDYMICKRIGDTFEAIGYTSETNFEISVDDINNLADIRVVARDNKGTNSNESDDINVLSNILTYEKKTDIIKDEDNNDKESISYEFTTKDTDGDGLEDGYEIWDFKTEWNSKDVDGNYILDSDEDGFSDGYEVFTLGTDPAVENEENMDSDEDGWSDLREYREGTDPWLKDSDFDGTNDRGDDTPRKTNDYTRQTKAAAASVHKGLYDRQYSESIDSVMYTYIANIYRGNIKKILVNYGDTSLNKVLKYFYDEKGNSTAIIEAYDESYDPNHTQTICITYTYNEEGNLTFICDQKTRYTMNYSLDGHITNLKVGSQTLMTYSDTKLISDTRDDELIDNIIIDGVIEKDEHTDTYGNGQLVKTITTTYKVDNNDTTSTATKIETYYNADENPTYVAYMNIDGEIIRLQDYSENFQNPVVWNYSYTDENMSLTRSDNFTKSIQMTEDEESGTSMTVTSYGHKDLKNNDKTYTTTITSSTEAETSEDGTEVSKDVILQTLHNDDTVKIETGDDSYEEKIHSNEYDTNIVKSNYEKGSITHATYGVDVYDIKDDKTFDYTYDLAGNITKIKKSEHVIYEYSYDAHGRITSEKDYTTSKEYAYDYNTNGNVYGKTEYPINENGSRTDSDGTTIHYTYDNNDWPDQLTKYNGHTITYDDAGNPLTYIDGQNFTWSRGKQLSQITFSDETNATYKYNESGLRIYKNTVDAVTSYEWDGSTLIRETVTYKNTNQKSDIWYIYDANGSAIGFEYNYLDFTGELITARVYYEKNLQGDIIGLLDARGVEIATYTYDAWGNITSTEYAEENEIPYELNHITYRGYYRDNETGFYYLQNRYYDAKVGRFINADDVKMIFVNTNEIYNDNYYVYCNSNPISLIDKNGNAPKKKIRKFSYNRKDVYKYMKKYYNVEKRKILFWKYKGYNTNFPYFDSDCTNFASQCLWSGGISMTSNWYCIPCIQGSGFAYTKSWTTVMGQREYIKKNFSSKSFEIKKNVTKDEMKNYINKNKPEVGDMIYFYSPKKKRYSHTAIVCSVTKDTITYAAHSDSRWEKSLMGPLNEGYYDHVEICHIKDEGSFYE